MWLTANGCDRHPAPRRWLAVLLPALLSVPAVTQAVEVRFSATVTERSCRMDTTPVNVNLGGFAAKSLLSDAHSARYRPALPFDVRVVCDSPATVRATTVTFSGTPMADVIPSTDCGSVSAADRAKTMVAVSKANAGKLGVGLRFRSATGTQGTGNAANAAVAGKDECVVLGKSYSLLSMVKDPSLPAVNGGTVEFSMLPLLSLNSVARQSGTVELGDFEAVVTVTLAQP